MNIEMEEQVQFLFYQGREGTIKIQVIADAERETIWATQASMADIFNVEVNTINYHLKNILSLKKVFYQFSCKFFVKLFSCS